jgi:hypothetical protein
VADLRVGHAQSLSRLALDVESADLNDPWVGALCAATMRIASGATVSGGTTGATATTTGATAAEGVAVGSDADAGALSRRAAAGVGSDTGAALRAMWAAVAAVLGTGAEAFGGASTGAGSVGSSRIRTTTGPSSAVWICVSFALMVFTWIGLMVALTSTRAADFVMGGGLFVPLTYAAANSTAGSTAAAGTVSVGASAAGTNLGSGQAEGGAKAATV